jgi:hypothetical protein
MPFRGVFSESFVTSLFLMNPYSSDLNIVPTQTCISEVEAGGDQEAA